MDKSTLLTGGKNVEFRDNYREKRRREMKIGMEIRDDGLVIYNGEGNIYDEDGKLINIFLGEIADKTGGKDGK